MIPTKSIPTLVPSFLGEERDLHVDPLVSTQALLKLLPGSNAMSLTRWRNERDMPNPVRHGKYSISAVLRWVWDWRCKLELELEEHGKKSRSSDPISMQFDAIKLRKATIELAELEGEMVNRREFEDAEAGRIGLAIAVLATLADRLIADGIIPDSARTRVMELTGEAVDAIQSNIKQGENA